ncbi:MAG: hypothetical protein QM564_05590 [Bergeyella sp.]
MTILSFEIEPSEVSKLKTILKAFGVKKLKVEEKTNDTEITNPVILERLHKLHHEYKEENYIRIDPKNLWKSISSK